ncbi:MAG: O-antigen ligase family protein [Methylococcales bacterium]
MEILILGGIGGMAGLIFWLLMPRLFTMLAIFFTLFQFGWFVRYYSAPPLLNRATLVMVGLLGLRVFVHFLLKKPSVRNENGHLMPLFMLAVYFIMLTLISNLYNEEKVFLGLYSLRYYFIGLTFTFALYLYCDDYLSFESFKKNIIYLALIQLPMSIAKYIAAGGGTLNTLDTVGGTFAGYGELVICQVIAIGIVLTDKFIQRTNTLPHINSYVLLLLIIIPLLLSKSKSATIFVIMIVLFVLIYSLFKRRNLVSALKHISLTSLICITFSSLFYIFFWKSGEYDISNYINPEYVLDYYMREPLLDNKRISGGADPNMGRFRAVYTAWNLVQQDIMHALLGYGAGSGSEASFLGVDGSLYQKSGPLAGIARNQYSKSILEFGMLGLIGIIYFCYAFGRRLRFIANTGAGLRIVYSVILVVLTILSVYTITLESYLFCFIFAYFIAVSHSELVRNTNNDFH